MAVWPLPLLSFNKTNMAKSNKVDQPGLEEQRELNRVVIDSVDEVDVRGRKYKVRWLRGYAVERVTEIMLSSVRESGNGQDLSSAKDVAKCAALLLLNKWWKIKLLYFFLWRWFYYVKEYGYHELFPIVEAAQKKMACQSLEYQIVTTYLTALRNTKMMMTRKEAQQVTRRERSGDSSGR